MIQTLAIPFPQKKSSSKNDPLFTFVNISLAYSFFLKNISFCKTPSVRCCSIYELLDETNDIFSFTLLIWGAGFKQIWWQC